MSAGVEARFRGRLGAFELDVAVSAPAAGVTVLFGPSGCGKTTVLRCLAGLTRLSGELRVGDQVWQDAGRFMPTHRRPIGYVFQEASLFEHLSVRGNLLYGRRRAGARQDDGFDRIVRLLDLGRLLERGPARLSGGERQRVALGRALLSEPALLLMDEPLSGLDAARKAEVLPYVEALHHEATIPVFYVTHDVTEGARLGKQMLLMEAGRIVRTLDLREATPGDEALERERLADRLTRVGADELRAELVLGGVPAAIARLALEALGARGG